MFVSQVGEHILVGIRVPRRGTHITRDMYFQGKGTHIRVGICVSQVGRVLHKKNMLGMIKTISFSFSILQLFNRPFFSLFSNILQAAKTLK